MKSKILLIGLMTLTLICCGCVEDGTSGVIDEYNKHIDTFNDDQARLGAIGERWNTAYEMAASDNDFTTEEVNQLIGITNEYIEESEFVKSHLTSFKEFIVANEQELKDAGVDTYQDKKDIDDVNIMIRQNIEEAMIPKLEYAIEYVETSEQEEDIEGAIEDLLNIVSIFI